MIKRNKTLLNSILTMACISFLIPCTISFADTDNTVLNIDSHTNITAYALDEYFDATANGVNWECNKLSDGTISVRCFSDITGAVEIPSKLNGYIVSTIGDYGFRYRNNITSIKIPSTVTTIGNFAFNGCENLEKIDIPSSVTTIKGDVFDFTKWLTNQRNANPLVIVNNILVDGRTASGDVIIPSNVTEIVTGAFASARSAVIEPGKAPNYEPSPLTSVVIPENVKSIGAGAFYQCPNLKNVTIKGDLTLGESAFANCENLTTVNIPSSIDIGDAFYNTPYLNNIANNSDNFVIVNGTLTEVKNAKGDIVIPESVTSISPTAFPNCNELTSVTFPSSISYIPGSLLDGAKNLKSVTLPEGIKNIGSYAFARCSSLKSVKLPSSITKLSPGVFSQCIELESVELPSNITAIPDEFFKNCFNLKTVNIPESVTSIGESAFQDAGITSITLPKNLKSIGLNGFIGCKKLTSINIPANVEEIDDGAFSYCEGLEEVTFEKSTKLTLLDVSVFAYCKSLEKFEIPSGITGMGSYAFYNCAHLKSIKIPNTVANMAANAFDECPNLRLVYAEGEYGKAYFKDKDVVIDSYVSSGNTTSSNNAVSIVTNAQPSDKGWVIIGNDWYYKDANGNNYTGWMNINNKIYYFYGDGTMAVSFVKLGDSIFYFNPVPGKDMGVSVIGWAKIDEYWYYFTPMPDHLGNKGMMQKGWLYNGGCWYYFYSDGKMAANTWIGNYYVNGSGAWVSSR